MRSKSGETARNIAVRHRHSAIVNLIDIAAQTICTQISEERSEFSWILFTYRLV